MKKYGFTLAEGTAHVVGQKKQRRAGFTLAEVLVTLGIIGVVAAMTMPTLMSNHQRKVYVTQLQKVYTELSQAAKRAISDNNAISLDETKYNRNNANGAKNFLHDYFNVVQDCGTDLTPCFGDSYTTLEGADMTLQTPVVAVSLASGASISVYHNGLSYERDWHGNLEMQVDINGAQGPNVLGRDLFYMGLYSDGKVAETYTGRDYDYAKETCASNEIGGYGVGCLTVIMEDGWTMDY